MTDRKVMREVLAKMEKIFGNIPHWIIGSLVLGLVREKGFIKKEHEFDYIIKFQDYKNLINKLRTINKDIVFNQETPNDDEITLRCIDKTWLVRIIKLQIDGVPIDINIGFDIGKNFYYLVHSKEYAINKFPKKLFDKICMDKIEGGIYPFPDKPLDYVERVYDKDWHIVKDIWDCTINPPCLIKDKEEFNKIFNYIKENYKTI